MRQLRRHKTVLRRTAVGALLAAAVLCSQGCATTPDPLETLRIIDQQTERLRLEREKELAACETTEDCEGIANKYAELIFEMNALRKEVVKEHWEEAKKAAKELRQKIIETIPTTPEMREILEDIRDIIDKFVGVADVTGTASTGTTLLGPVIPIEYSLAGTVEIDDWLYEGEIGISGSLDASGSVAAGTFNGTIASGSVALTLPGPFVVTATILENEPDLPSTLSAVVGGAGEISLVLEFDEQILDTYEEWGALIGSPTIIRVPISMATDYGLSFQHTGQFGDLFPYEPWPASDYDNDGVLDPNDDLAAFLIGHANQEWLADTNADGVWDFYDLLLWQEHFSDDYNQ